MQGVININGKICSPEEATIPVLDHGFLYGDSVYETLRTYRRKPFLFGKHFARLEHSAQALHLRLPWNHQKMLDETRRTIEASKDGSELRIRIVVTRGVGELNLDPSSCASPNVVIMVTPLPELPGWVFEKGARVIISSVHRIAQFGGAKTGNLVRQVLAFQEAQAVGAYEAILLRPDGAISDGISSNIYIIKGSTLLTPSHDSGIVEGITRSVVLQLARRQGLNVIERVLNRTDLDGAEEMFLTSTTRGVVPITQVDNLTIGNGKPGLATLRLIEAFRREVEALLAED
jgi:branched-chain amino acid aminotransferase